MDLTAFSEDEREEVLEILANSVCQCGYKRKDHVNEFACPHFDGRRTSIMSMYYTGKFIYSEYYNYE